MGDRISLIPLPSRKGEQQHWRERFAPAYRERRSKAPAPWTEVPSQEELNRCHASITDQHDLTFEQAFRGMCFVLAATNAHFFDLLWKAPSTPGFDEAISKARLVGGVFLKAMADKESFSSLTPEEVAGLAAATLMDTMFQLEIPRVVETCGMGGDRGFQAENGHITKSVNVSTLSSIVLSALGLPTIKHGSYRNTSAVGSTDAIEQFGAKTSAGSVAEIMDLWRTCNFCYLDAHLCKTVHDLSHLLGIETINHIVGPMSLPVSTQTEVNKLMGVNAKIHPSVVAKAYTMLHRRKIQRMGGIAIIGGLTEAGMDIDPSDPAAFKKYCVLDEVSPYASVASIGYRGTFLGSFMIRPEDFGISIHPESIQVINNPEAIYQANTAALRDQNTALADYVAVNAALGLFTAQHISRGHAVKGGRLDSSALRRCYTACREAIASGQAWRKLLQYVEASGGVLSFR